MDERNLKLKNSFIDMMLLVGMDNNSGLFPKDLEEGVSPSENIFYIEYQPKVLDCFCSNTVRHFFPSQWEEIFSNSETFDLKLKQKFSEIATGNNNVMPKPIHFTKPSKPTANQISDEDIQNLATFCFPDGVKLSAERLADFKINYLVLTNLLGERNYATSLIFHRKYKAEKGVDTWQLKPFEENQSESNSDSPSSEALTVYVPHACVFISKQPYFTVMKQCLSILLGKIKNTLDYYLQMVIFQQFVRQLCVIPLPPTGTLAVGVKLLGHEVILHPAHYSSIPILDFSLRLVFQCFTFDTIIEIITCLLTEKQIVFLSSSYALLTMVTESLCSLIYPFSWCHTYVPVVPTSCLELLEAPGSFIMGCHLRNLSKVKQISGLVIVNIDQGNISINQLEADTADGFTMDIPMMPEEPVKILAEVYETIKFNFDLIDLERPNCFNHNEEVQFRSQKISAFNKRMQYAFVELMVNLFRDIALECKADLKCFKRNNFLEKQIPQNIPFYKEVLKTMIFQQFLDNILSQKPSFWSEVELKTRTLSRRSISCQNAFVSSSNNMAETQQGPVSTSITEELPRESIFFVPSIKNSDFCIEYLKECIKLCTEKIEVGRDFSHRTSLIYLRGMYRYSCSEYKTAYEDLKTLHESADSIYIPAQLINDASSKIPAYDRPDTLVVEDENPPRRRPQTIDNEEAITLPKNDIEFKEFMKLLYLLDICHCYEIRKQSFKALSNEKPFVNPTVLSVFLKSWQQNRDQCSRLPQLEKELPFPEWFLCVSSRIRTNKGIGCFVITNRRLLFLRDMTKNFKSLCRLQQIDQIQKKIRPTIGGQIGQIIITTKDSQNIEANLRKHQEMWYLILSEILAAKLYSIEHKDKDAILMGAETVLIMMALENCKSSLRPHGINIEQVAFDMCFFFQCQKAGRLSLSKYTGEVLKIKMNPNLNDEQQTILDILFVSKGDRSQLWCALGNGRVRVIHTNEWELEKEFVQTNENLKCLFSPSSQWIWAGCVNIFIINTDRINCLTKLTAHEEPVVAIIQAESTSYAFSASVDGIIHKWDVTSLKSVEKIKVDIEEGLKNIELHDNLIWCVSKKSLLIVDLNGVAIKAVEPSCMLKATNKKPMILQCFHIMTSTKEIWLGYSNTNRILVLDSTTYEIKDNINLKYYGRLGKGVTALIKVKNDLWIATKEGYIHIYDLQSHQKLLVLKGHEDTVHCFDKAADRYVFSGSGISECKIAVWSVYMLDNEHVDRL